MGSTKELFEGAEIVFDAAKKLTYVSKLGSGGTGDTHLFFDKTTDIYFAVKKYSPKDLDMVDEYYKRFVDEIKILFRIAHPNIVRIYNYYLYPEVKLGYLQMEYIDGQTIDKFKPDNIKGWNEIFIEAINIFSYLEYIGVLHRDIRPANFMITKDNSLKLIDFGFGKKVDGSKYESNSILLNWPVTKDPEEIVIEQNYDFRTEIYYLGNMFKNLIKEYDDFSFFPIISKMCEIATDSRYQSFEEIKAEISTSLFSEIQFSNTDKEVYRKFADALSSHVVKFHEKPSFFSESKVVIDRLSSVIKNNALEVTIKGNQNLISCFITDKTNFTYKPTDNIELSLVQDFYKLLIKVSNEQKSIIISNICNRLKTIKVEYEFNEELPF